MAEPAAPSTTATLLLAALIASFGPLVGQYMVILGGAFGGCLVALMSAPPSSLGRGVLYIGKGTVASIFITGPIAYVWTSQLGLPVGEILALASFFVGLRTDWVLDKLTRRVGGGEP